MADITETMNEVLMYAGEEKQPPMVVVDVGDSAAKNLIVNRIKTKYDTMKVEGRLADYVIVANSTMFIMRFNFVDDA